MTKVISAMESLLKNMTKQEVIQQIRNKNPQYKSLPDNVLLDFAIRQKPELKSQITDYSEQSREETARNMMMDIAQNQRAEEQPAEQQVPHPLRDLGVGVLKGLGRTIVETGETARDIFQSPAKLAGKITGIEAPGFVKRGEQISEQSAEQAMEELAPKNVYEKAGGYLETVGELLLPSTAILKATKSVRELLAAKKALSLSTKELAKISSSKFKKIFGVEKGELTKAGGLLKEEYLKLPKKAEELAKEFKNVLSGKNATKNLELAKKEGAKYWEKTLNLFEGNNKSFNPKQIRGYLDKAIREKVPFSSEQEMLSYSKTALNDFMKNLKTGTLKGLEEARAKFRYAGTDTSGKLKSSYETIHNAIKEVVKANLPEEKRAAYDLYKQKTAKLFDVREILKAKNLVLEKSKIKEIGKKAAAVGAIAAGIEAVRRIIK